MSSASKHSVRALQDEMWPDLDETQRQVLTVQRTSGKRLDQLLSEIAREGLTAPGEIAAMLTARHGLAADGAAFMAELAQKADPAALDADKQALKAAFTYRSYGYDLWQVLFDDLDRPFYAAIRALELSYYAPAAEFLEDCYYEAGALEPMVKVYSGQAYRFEGVFAELLGHLEQAGRFDLIERLWTAIARRTRAQFFLHRPDRELGAGEQVEELKALALEAYEKGVGWLTRLGRAEGAERLAAEREALLHERMTDLPPASDLRRMDEPTFWTIIARVRAAAPTTLEQLAVLGETLRAFDAAQIKRFAALYAKLMKKLYHWNVWALAYAARGGCSDDAFEEFRTWLILQGDAALIDLAIADPAAAARQVPPDPDLPDGSCLWTIGEAYLQRKGLPLELPTLELEKPKGRIWREEALEATFPALVRHYEDARRSP